MKRSERAPLYINKRDYALKKTAKAMQRSCEGCYYFSGWNCDYILFEKKRRPCPPGSQCTVKSSRRITAQDRARIHAMSGVFPSRGKRKAADH